MMQPTFNIVPAQAHHDKAIRYVIESVGAEFGATGEGFGPSDPEVLSMSLHYTPAQKGQYLVALVNDEVVGGCGIAPFNGQKDICELRKLFLLPASRGLGIGKQLMIRSLDFARQNDFKHCYLDTMMSMTAAISMYENFGFKRMTKPLAGAVHCGCDVWMMAEL